MGTVASVVVGVRDVERRGVASVDQAIAAARDLLQLLDRRFSHYRTDSEISRWGRGEHVGRAAAADIEHVLRECALLYGDSDGVFDARDPRTGELDTAGYVKGYAIRRAAETLLDAGMADFVVGVGGDVHASGRAEADRPWRVAVQDPVHSHAVLALVEVADGAVATSGTAQRGEHIWNGAQIGDPGSGRRDRVLSFTVVGPDIALADAYATIGFALGDSGPAWVRRHEGYRSLVVRADGSRFSDAALVSSA
jgi:thiamine biosynthesis lipoprotein